MGREGHDSPKGFTFKDRRRIFKDKSDEAKESRETETRNPLEPPEEGAPPESGHESDEEPGLPTFAGLLMSFASGVLMGLGLVPDPLTGKKEVHFAQADHSMAILELLQEKTKGNLTDQEAELLEGLLYDLRMKYVEVKKQKGG